MENLDKYVSWDDFMVCIPYRHSMPGHDSCAFLCL